MSKKNDNYQKPNHSIPIEEHLITYGMPNRSGKEQVPEYIIIHEVSLGIGRSPEPFNMDYYAAKIEKDGENGSCIGYHFLVGDKKIYQFIKENEVTYHTGTEKGNNSSIGIERLICEGVNYEYALHNQAKLIATLMIKWNIPIDHVVTHKQIQQIYAPTVKNYDLKIEDYHKILPGDNKRNFTQAFSEQFSIVTNLFHEIVENNNEKINDKKAVNILEVWESELSETNGLLSRFHSLTEARQICELFRLVAWEGKFRQLISLIKDIEYIPLDKTIGELKFKEVIQTKNCPSRLLIGQRGGLTKFYREIKKCLENNCLFKEILNSEQIENLKKR